jgi:RNA polymerase sigma-70 factor (ECF subfamily)
VADRAACDQRVVRAVLAGDREAFSDLVARYQKLVASVAWRYGTRQEEIEDLVSEVFFKVYRNLHQYRPDHAFSTWLYRLAANHVLDHARRARLVRSALQEVRPRYREVLFLVYVEGFRVEEAARALGVPQGTIKSRLLRGREALRKILSRRHPELIRD